jgi:hypothetical protein
MKEKGIMESWRNKNEVNLKFQFLGKIEISLGHDTLQVAHLIPLIKFADFSS